MDKKELVEFLGRLDHSRIKFTEHFEIRNETRNLGKGRIEDFLLNRPGDLAHADEETSSNGLRRIKA